MREMVGGCCVCSDDRGWSENPLVYCDGQSCTVAVHQACYGIVSVPVGPWYCRKCESQERTIKVKCELCPSKYGALKRTDNSGWAHVVCALYIPEVRFGNVTTMEPIQLQLIPAERFNKVCYICEEKSRPANAGVGACMQCNKAGCKQQFHVTCAQGLGLLCEEAGNYLDNVKYCGYCQHHYSKLKKGGNVKTIPPYKPISTENHLSDSSSEKEAESATISSNTSKTAPPQPSSSSSKRKSSSSNKTASSKTSSSNSKSSTTSSTSNNPKTVNNSTPKIPDKLKVTNSSARSAKTSDDIAENTNSKSVDPKSSDKKELKTEAVEHESRPDLKESKGSKKRKANSRTPTPVTLVPSESTSVVVNSSSTITAVISSANITSNSDKKDTAIISSDSIDKPKKAKVETTQSIISNQPVVALTSISAIKAIPLPTTTTELTNSDPIISTSLPTQVIQTTPTTTVNSLVVSVPLTSTALSPHPHLVNNQTSVLASTASLQVEKSNSAIGNQEIPSETGLHNTEHILPTMLTSEMSGGGLKITYEKQESLGMTSEVDMELEESPPQEVPAKRTSRSQSNDKTEKGSRGKKRGNGNGSSQANIQLNNTNRRASRSQHSTPPPHQGAFSSISQSQIKDSPPSSPSSESQGAPSSSRGRTKGRKSAPAAVSSNSSRDNKDVKLFQNGVTAPHMLGNQLNPNSNMAQKMSDHLNSELEAHSIFTPTESVNLMGPQLHHRVIASARASSTGGSSTGSGASGLSSMLGGGGGTIPQTLDQLLERQWEQGSQFLMEQAQHFDIASLLSCLHQLRAENVRLEEHVSSLLQRRDHLLAVNARLAIPLTGQPATPQSSHPHTVNNIHPAVAASHGDIPRTRHSSGSASYPAHPQGSGAAVPVENGLPPDPNQPYPSHTHRSPAPGQPQRSPTVRLSPAGSGYSNNGLLRQSADTSGRSAPRPQPYPLYQGPGPSSQQQMVIRRDTDAHHQTSKPS